MVLFGEQSGFLSREFIENHQLKGLSYGENFQKDFNLRDYHRSSGVSTVSCDGTNKCLTKILSSDHSK